MVAKVVSGELDIAAVPTNVQLPCITKHRAACSWQLNTMGVVHRGSRRKSIQSVADLKGKTIYSTGQGSTPEYDLNLVLEKNGLTVGEDVTVVYKTDNSEIAPLLVPAKRRWRCFHSRL